MEDKKQSRFAPNEITNANSKELNASNASLINSSALKTINPPQTIHIRKKKQSTQNALGNVNFNNNSTTILINDANNYPNKSKTDKTNLTQIHKLKLIELTHIKLFKSLEYKREKNNLKNKTAIELNIIDKSIKKGNPIRPLYKRFTSLTSLHKKGIKDEVIAIEEGVSDKTSPQCKVCLKTYPKLISFACGHSLCSSCLFQLFQQFVVSYEDDKKLLCPTCGKLIDSQSLFQHLNDFTMIILFVKLTKQNGFVIQCPFCPGYALSLQFKERNFNIEILSKLHSLNLTKCENGHCFCLYCMEKIKESAVDEGKIQHNCLFIPSSKKRSSKNSQISSQMIACSKCKNIIRTTGTQNSAVAVQGDEDDDEEKSFSSSINNLFKCPKCNSCICLICKTPVNALHFFNPFNTCFLMQKVRRKATILSTKYIRAIHHLAVLLVMTIIGFVLLPFIGYGIFLCVIWNKWYKGKPFLRLTTKEKTISLRFTTIGYFFLLSSLFLLFNIVIALCWTVVACFALVWTLCYSIFRIR